jgi:hypothetical protein
MNYWPTISSRFLVSKQLGLLQPPRASVPPAIISLRQRTGSLKYGVKGTSLPYINHLSLFTDRKKAGSLSPFFFHFSVTTISHFSNLSQKWV